MLKEIQISRHLKPHCINESDSIAEIRKSPASIPVNS